MKSPTRERLIVSVLTAGLLSIAMTVPTASQPAAHARPAHIHNGTCERLGDVSHPLIDVAPIAMMRAMGQMTPASGSPMMTPGAGSMMGGQPGTMMGNRGAIGVEISDTMVDAGLADLLQGDHAINIHESAADIGTSIACGDLGGEVLSGGDGNGGTLVVGLREVNGSGHSGIAVLLEQGNQTEVTIFLSEGLNGQQDAAATPSPSSAAATPGAATDSGPAQGAAVAVAIKDIVFNPVSVEVSAGTTVTWTNEDPVPHTVTGKDNKAIKSGVMNEGDTYSFTFDTLGTYSYYCAFHAGMTATVVVK